MGAVGENGLTLSTHLQAGGDCPGPEERTWGSGGNRSGGLALALLNAAALHRERDCPAVSRRGVSAGACGGAQSCAAAAVWGRVPPNEPSRALLAAAQAALGARKSSG